MIRLTPEAVAVIKRSLDLAQLDASKYAVRLRLAGGAVRPRFVENPDPGDEVAEAEGVRVFVDPKALEGRTDAEVAVSDEHETLILR